MPWKSKSNVGISQAYFLSDANIDRQISSFTPPANTVPANVQRGKQFTQPWTAFSMPSKVSAVPSN